MLECWAAQIPEAYRWTGKYYSPRGDPARGAIIGPKPPAQMLARFFANLSPLHLAADQRRAKEARERCGKPGRRKGDNLTSADRTQPPRARELSGNT
jgi:hypothetical protein